MFQEARLLGPTERNIVVQTRKGTDLSNVIEPEPTLQQRRQYRGVLEQFGRNWVERKPATGGYNCAGQVWASRRTSLTAAEQWQLILEEDGYRRLGGTEKPLPGDLAVYVDDEDGEIIHVGRVIEIREGLTPDAAPMPWVLSKWGPVGGEVMHYGHDVPYRHPQCGYALRTEYWTDR